MEGHTDHDEVFEEDGRPIYFCLYQGRYGGLTPGQAEVLQKKIEAHGGYIVEEEEDADTIIVTREGLERMRLKFFDSKTIYVEDPTFVGICIRTRQYLENHEHIRRKGMGGRPAGETRTPFTRTDDDNLARYLATVVPNKEEGGRTGRAVYERLYHFAEERRDRDWVLRHPPSSWLERYRKNQEKFDAMIEKYILMSPPHPHGKAAYERSRLYNRRLGIRIDIEEEDDGEEENEDRELRERARSAQHDSRPLFGKRRRSEWSADHSGERSTDAKRARYERAMSVANGQMLRTPQRLSAHRGDGTVDMSWILHARSRFEASSEGEEEDDLQQSPGEKSRGSSAVRSARESLRRQSSRSSQESEEVFQHLTSPDKPDAGPSGTQQTPSMEASGETSMDLPASPTQALSAKAVGKRPARLYKRPASPPQLLEAAASSQATLVGGATQPTPARQERHDFDEIDDPDPLQDSGEHIDDAQQTPQPPVVIAPNEAPRGERAASALMPPPASLPAPRGFKGARRGRRINVISPPRAAHPLQSSAPALVEDITLHSGAGTQTRAEQPNPPETLAPQETARSTIAASIVKSLQAGTGTNPSTPTRTGAIQRSGTGSSTSDVIPLPGTRASEEKSRRNVAARQEADVLTPAPGTRAALYSEEKSFRRLRSRVVKKA